MYCKNCGEQLPDESKYCIKCGHKMNGQPDPKADELKKTLSWQQLLLIAVGSYILGYIFGGIVGSALNMVGFITLILSIIAAIRNNRTK